MQLACPHCGQSLIDDGSFAGQQVICPACQGHMIWPGTNLTPQLAPVQLVEEPLDIVQIMDDGQVTARYRDVGEAKLAIKELRLIKRQIAHAKREVNLEQRAIRADYTDEVRRRGSKMRGGGSVGRFVRAIQTISRDSRQHQLASELHPHESRKQRLEELLHAVESVILQVEYYIHANGH